MRHLLRISRNWKQREIALGSDQREGEIFSIEIRTGSTKDSKKVGEITLHEDKFGTISVKCHSEDGIKSAPFELFPRNLWETMGGVRPG